MTLESVGGAILQSFWWITAAAVVLAISLRAAGRVSSECRYWLAVAALLSAPVAFLSSFRLDSPSSPALMPPFSPGALADAIGDSTFAGADWARPLAIAWLCGVVLLSLRTIGGWVYLRRLIRRAVPFELPAMNELCRRIGLTQGVELRSTDRADSPFTAGWRRPVIVVPLATLAGLPTDQLEAILLHELAHIRRYDYVAEWIVQSIETLFFYHPAVWWMTAMLRKERERSCDDMSIASGADRGCYARALLTLEEMRVPALGIAGAGGNLHERVARILGERVSSPAWPAILVLSLAVFAPLAPAQNPTRYEKWVNQDALYIIQPEERRAYEALRTDPEREQFIGQFWLRRDPTPGTEDNEFKDEHYRRIAYSNERFREQDKSGWRTERGRIYIVFGPPDEIETHPVENFHQWRYKTIPGVGNNVIFEFGNRTRK